MPASIGLTLACQERFLRPHWLFGGRSLNVCQVNHGKGDVMLIKAKALKGYSLKGLDGDIGSASEFFFDDRYWAV